MSRGILSRLRHVLEIFRSLNVELLLETPLLWENWSAKLLTCQLLELHGRATDELEIVRDSVRDTMYWSHLTHAL